ncbi:hypothetical protein HDV02_000412 [Globomyces sp. JEL0801]|nr:hypothetical protein HDV02_000412 [Globomyces sp. JEL0801]
MKTFSNSKLTRSSQSNLSKDIPKHLNSEYGKLKKAKFNSTTSLIGSSKPNRNYTGNDSIVSKPDIQRSSLKKTGSTGNILPRRTHVPPQINQPIKFQWKKTNTNDHLIGNSKEGFEKDLPRTSYYKQNVSQVDRKQLKQDLIALSEHVREQGNKIDINAPVNLQPPTTLFYNFLLSHCFKLTNVDVNKIGIRLKELANDSVKNDLQPVLEAWASVQEIYMEEAMKRDTVIDGLMREFERMEEYNNLFKDFVEQRAAYPENKVIQIEVKQVFKQIQNIQVKEEVLHEEVIQTNITAEKIHDEIEKETQSASTQTEYNAEFDTKLVKVLEYDRSNIDLMDKATGPDRV